MAITLDGNNLTTTGLINSGNTQSSTSGTSIDFTGIPSGVKRVTVLFNQVSTSGTSQLLVRIGSGAIDATSYSSNALYSGGILTDTTGYVVGGIGAGDFRSGACVLQLMGSNVWTAFGSLNVGTNVFVFGGIHTTGGALDRLRVTPSNGTDTFDSGSINILWE